MNLDAMIPREDFGLEGDEFAPELIRDFQIAHLQSTSPILKSLRKPDFQRETNHWSPSQVVTFVASFLDAEVIPSLILWKSPSFIFVIDGGHRLSALRAWIEDDYGDGTISQRFYNGEISEDQKRIAKATRRLIEDRIGRFSTLQSLVGSKLNTNDILSRRAGLLFTRPLLLQWVQGTPLVAETSFFKINSQGTPLDETEQMLIRNRRRPIAISARAILRAGAGHKYWSAFNEDQRLKIESLSNELFRILFQPEVTSPIKTLDIPLGGSVSPVEALSWLIEFLTVAASRDQVKIKGISDYDEDETGDETIGILSRSLNIANRITGNSPGSLGLHPAVYFYNEKGKHARFLFLGMISLVAERIRSNDSEWFRKFTKARSQLERFLIDNKSLIGILLQNMSKAQRIPKMRDLFAYLVREACSGNTLSPESAIAHLGLRGRIIDVVVPQMNSQISDDTKSMIFIRRAIDAAIKCPVCGGLLDPAKSVSYDHKIPICKGGTGDQENTQLAHPYCNTAIKGDNDARWA